MIRCGRSTIPTMLRHNPALTGLFKISAVAPKFGRFQADREDIFNEPSREIPGRLGPPLLPHQTPDRAKVKVLFAMVRPSIQRVRSSVIYHLGTGEIDVRKPLAAAQPVQPCPAKRRLIKQAMDIGSPDQAIAAHR